DVYSLGVTLYELLTGTPAVDGKDREEILNALTGDEPRRPRAIDAAIPRDLETIVLKATEKDAADRYATAGALADDMRRFLEHRPIQAKPSSLAKKLRKWAQRHRGIVTTAVALLTALAITLAVSTVLVWRAYQAEAEQRRRADANYQAAEEERRLA